MSRPDGRTLVPLSELEALRQDGAILDALDAAARVGRVSVHVIMPERDFEVVVAGSPNLRATLAGLVGALHSLR